MRNPIPPAIQWILSLADRGATSATIIFILAVGPDRVQRHLGDVALLYGTKSPQLAHLRKCLDEARRAISEQTPLVSKQHFISKGILCQFCELVRPKSGQELMAWDLCAGSCKLRSPSQHMRRAPRPLVD
jgi:hypothetical protein